MPDGIEKALVIRNCLLIDGTGRAPVQHASILIEDGRIVQVTEEALSARNDLGEIDATGKVVIPGLVDMHAHLISGGFDMISDRGMIYDYARCRRILQQMLYWGVTSVCSPVQPLDFGLRLRRESLEQGDELPELLISGPGFTAPGGWAGTNDASARFEPASADEARAQMDSLAEAGVDFVKVFYDDMGCAFREALPELLGGMLEAVVEAAHRCGLKVMVHAYDTVNHRRAIEAGADIMAHSAVTALVDDDYLAAARSAGLLYLATLSVYHDAFDAESIRRLIAQDFVRQSTPASTLATLAEGGPLDAFEEGIRQSNIARLLPVIRDNLLAAWEGGVTIGVGPDTGVMGVFPGIAVHREMELMADCGVPPAAILEAATWAGMRHLGRGEVGTIEPGKRANLLILQANPLNDIRATRRIVAVIKEGMIVNRQRLLEEALGGGSPDDNARQEQGARA